MTNPKINEATTNQTKVTLGIQIKHRTETLTVQHLFKNILGKDVNIPIQISYPYLLIIYPDKHIETSVTMSTNGIPISTLWRPLTSKRYLDHFDPDQVKAYLTGAGIQSEESLIEGEDEVNTAYYKEEPTMTEKEKIYGHQTKPALISIQVSQDGYEYLGRMRAEEEKWAADDMLNCIQYKDGWTVMLEFKDVLNAISNEILLPQHILNWRATSDS